jgi:hypothetical protein
MDSEAPPPNKPDFGDFLHAGMMQSCAAMALLGAVVAICGLILVGGSLLGLPYVLEIAGVLFVLGLGVFAFVSHDTNTRVRLMRSLAEERSRDGTKTDKTER